MATALLHRLQVSRMAAQNAACGLVTADHGVFVEISLGQADGMRPGQIMEVTYLESAATKDIWYCRRVRAATLCVLRADESRSFAKIIENRVNGRLDDPKFRVGYFRTERCPVEVAADTEQSISMSRSERIVAILASALEDKLAVSPYFALAVPQPSTGALDRARRGTLLMDQGNYVYVNLNHFDGVQVSAILEVTRFAVSGDDKGALRAGQTSVALLQVMRVDPQGALCRVTQRSVSEPLGVIQDACLVRCLGTRHPEIPRLEPHAEIARSLRGQGSVDEYEPARLVAYSAPVTVTNEVQRMSSRPPVIEDDWTHTIRLGVQEGRGGQESVLATVRLAGPFNAARPVVARIAMRTSNLTPSSAVMASPCRVAGSNRLRLHQSRTRRYR